jgi:thioester reductase-like protein
LVDLKAFWLANYPALSSDLIAQRIRPVAGEITEPLLGLSDSDRAELARTCTNIIHCAASVRMNLPLAEARQTALFPVQSVLELGKTCPNLRKVEFISTVGVGGRWEGPLPERWIDEPREFHNTYEASKAEAETLVRGEIAQGFPATIHRPSMVVGDSVSGAVIHFQIFYFICDFLSGRRTLGFYPSLETGTLDIVPNDYVARAIVAAACDTATVGRLFHLCSGPARAVRLKELRELVRREFRSAGRSGWLPTIDLSRQNFTRLMHALAVFLPARERRALDTLPIYLDYLSGIQQFGNEETTRKLAGYGIAAPDNAAVLARVLAYYLKNAR